MLADVFFGRKVLQPLYTKMLSLAYRGLNYGQASRYASNGEKRLLTKLAKCFGHDQLVLMDVGANRGAFTMSLRAAFAQQAFTLHTFEPAADSFRLLTELIPAQASVHLHQLALSNQSGEAPLYADKAASSLASLYPRDLNHLSIDFSQQEKVKTATLTSFCQEHTISYIHFLKLDTEGHELSILQGGKSLISADAIEVIQFEFGGCNIDSRTYFRDYYLLLDPKYRIFRIVRDGLVPINHYSERLEVFLSCNYLAVHRTSKLLSEIV